MALLDRCARSGTLIVAAGAFNSGILAGNRKFNYADAPTALLVRVDALRALCSEAGVFLEAVALQFPMAHPAVVSVVSGARNAAQITSNVAWIDEPIPQAGSAHIAEFCRQRPSS